MSIVFITIPGEAKQLFANTLHKNTGNGVELVIVQKQKPLSLFERLLRLIRRVGILNVPREVWFGFLLRLNGTRHALEYFRAHTVPALEPIIPKTMEVDSVNSDEVYATLKKISPDLLVIWGSALLEPSILKTAKHAINLHMGYCPHYRGALANQHAMLRDDVSHIGATIHFAEERVDAGDILATITPDLTMPPR